MFINSLRHLPRAVVMIGLYYLSGRFCLHLAATGMGYVSPIWVPVGIAVAGVMLFGESLLPAVWIGAFLVNFFVKPDGHWQTFAVSAAIATGNVFECALIAHLLKRKFKVSLRFERVADVAGLIAACAFGPLVSATIGIFTVAFGTGMHLPLREMASIWEYWWIADMLGAMIISPVLILLVRPEMRSEVQVWNFGSFAFPAILLFMAMIVLSGAIDLQMKRMFLGFILYSVLFWCATSTSIRILLVALMIIAVFMTARAYLGLGMFGQGELVERLSFLQLYLCCQSTTLMVVSAMVSERVSDAALARERERAMLRSEKMSALGEMTSGIAHEISNPLSVIYGKTDQALLVLSSGHVSSEKLLPLIEKIDAMARRIEKIVNSIRFFSRKSEDDPFRS